MKEENENTNSMLVVGAAADLERRLELWNLLHL
jgi:hypothetical protein